MAKKKVAQPKASEPVLGAALQKLVDGLMTVESQLRVAAGACQAIENEVWTPLRLPHLTSSLHALGNEVLELMEGADRVLMDCHVGDYAKRVQS